MTLVNGMYKTGEQQICGDAMNTVSSSSATEARGRSAWYILRYKVLNRRIRDYFSKHSDQVFFPFRKVSKESEKNGKTDFVEQPCIPGYIFVHASLKDAIKLGKEVNMNLWKRNDNTFVDVKDATSLADRRLALEHQYYSIPDRVMEMFIDVVTHFQNGIRVYDPAEIDVEQDDEVEFISGPLSGQHGYIRIENGKAGGIVIVPLPSSEASASSPQSRNLLHYGVHAKPAEFRIVRFANNARHKDCIKVANAYAIKVLKAYTDGKPIEEKEGKRLRGYLVRYVDAEMNTDIQRVQHVLLMYRINTILEDYAMCARVRKHIEYDILPSYDRRIAMAYGNRKNRIIRQKKKFLQEISFIEGAPKERHASMS